MCICAFICIYLYDKIEAVFTGKYIALVYNTGGLERKKN